MYKADLYTVPINLAGLCSMSMPMGEVEGLPVGLQIIGARFGEEKVIKTGLALEEVIKK